MNEDRNTRGFTAITPMGDEVTFASKRLACESAMDLSGRSLRQVEVVDEDTEKTVFVALGLLTSERSWPSGRGSR